MSFLEQLNSVQHEAVNTLQGPVMIVAGAGSGKTRVLTYRIARLIQIGVPAYQILALTFTNKAANEMKERISQLVGVSSKSIWMGTFHSMFARVLRAEGDKLGYGKNFTIYDELDSLNVIKNAMNSLSISFQQYQPSAIRARISSAKNRLIDPDEYAKQAVDLFDEVTAKVYARYLRQLKQNNAMDFDDLLLLPIQLFEHHKKVLDKYQDRFRFILVDEYQDTNHAQYVLLKLLASKYRNICVVGDDAQSIYAFRGADIRNILDFQCDYPDAKVFRLEENYRSTKTILSAADQIIKNNVDQISKNLWTQNKEGEPLTVLFCSDDQEEGLRILSKISEEVYQNKFEFKDFALLYRTNAQSRSLEDALRKNGIPYTIIGGVEFYQRKEIKDVLAYFKVLVNPLDNESLLRIINYPSRGVGDVAISRLKAFAEKVKLTLLDAAGRAGEIPQLGAKSRENLLSVSRLFKKYQDLLNKMSMSELTRSLVDELGILRLLKDEGTPEALSRWENVQELLSAISEYSSDKPEASLENFLEEVSLVSDIDEWEDSHNAVTLMTLHSAKGLEFPVVFITGLEEGLLPLYTTTLDRTELEEERRLFYVGITRAMKKVYLSYTAVRYRFGDITYPTHSRFLDEIGAEHLQKVVSIKKNYAEEMSTNAKVQSHHYKRGKKSKEYFADTIPDYEHEYELRIGMMVEHEMFGRGKILGLSGNGEGMKAIVEFTSVGKKQLLLKYARLKAV